MNQVRRELREPVATLVSSLTAIAAARPTPEEHHAVGMLLAALWSGAPPAPARKTGPPKASAAPTTPTLVCRQCGGRGHGNSNSKACRRHRPRRSKAEASANGKGEAAEPPLPRHRESRVLGRGHRWRKACRVSFRTKRDLLAAIDRANEGLLIQALEVLDPGAPELRELSEHAGRRGSYAFKRWHDAVHWVAPPKSKRFEEVDPARLATVSEAMRRALTASAGGVTDLGRGAALAWPGLVLPHETEQILEQRQQAERLNRVAGVPF